MFPNVGYLTSFFPGSLQISHLFVYSNVLTIFHTNYKLHQQFHFDALNFSFTYSYLSSIFTYMAAMFSSRKVISKMIHL